MKRFSMSSPTFSPSDSFDPPEENRLYPELFALHREIHEFSKNLDDLPSLLKIQKRIIVAISEAEKEIQDAKKVKHDPRGWQYVRYNFLCLGDCLAFLYIDRFALKQTYLDVATGNPKQSGGFISGKAGHKKEILLLENAILHNVPAVLCDITNVLRYGDICLLGASDPVPIEVKSSKTKDRRSKRQKDKLKALSDFLTEDRAQDFRGIPGTTVRTEFSDPPKLFISELQAAVEEAIGAGTKSFEVDECLKVIVIAEDDPDYDKFFGWGQSSRVLVNSVNQIKTNMLWGCYYPYPLTLSEPATFEGFVRGEVHIFTLLDMAAFEDKLASEGARLTVEANEYDIQCHIHFSDLSNDNQEAYFIIGEHMMCRIWTDFLCPSWIVQNSISSIRNNAEAMSKALEAAANHE